MEDDVAMQRRLSLAEPIYRTIPVAGMVGCVITVPLFHCSAMDCESLRKGGPDWDYMQHDDIKGKQLWIGSWILNIHPVLHSSDKFYDGSSGYLGYSGNEITKCTLSCKMVNRQTGTVQIL